MRERAISAAVLVPVLLIVLAIGGYVAYESQQDDIEIDLPDIDLDAKGAKFKDRITLSPAGTAGSKDALVLMSLWGVGNWMVIYLAALQDIPEDLYEAARLDGAGWWSRMRHVTLPMLRPTLLFGGVITGIGYLQLFEEPFVMTQGGPLDSTLSLAYHTYNQFGFGNYGYAAAASYVLFAAIVALSVLQFRLLRAKD